MNNLTYHSSTHPDLYDLESGHYVLSKILLECTFSGGWAKNPHIEPPDMLTDFYESAWPRSLATPRTIPREVHDRLREESFSKYAELWSNLANM